MDAPAVLRPAPPRRPLRAPVALLRLASDERLVDLVRAGSEPAFEAIFDRHHRGILTFCRHMLGSADEAEDVVQHVFLAAYRTLRADDRRQMHLRAWLYTIARNRCLSVLRARRERSLDETPEPSTEHLADAVQRRDDLRTMLRDVAALPEDQRAALVLAELGDVSHEEIAQVLGVRREKVKALVFQARSSLAASRIAREVPCSEVREQLAELRGGSLRRTSLRRHLRECSGCREFRRALAAQRRALAVLLPVVPTAGLKSAVMGSAFGGSAAAAGGAATGAGAGSGAAGGGAAAGASGTALTASSMGGAGLAAKALVVVAVAGSGAAVGARELTSHPAPAPPHGAPARDGRVLHERVRGDAPRVRLRGVSAAGSALPAIRDGAAAADTGSRRSRDDAASRRGHHDKARKGSPASDIAHDNGHRALGQQPAGADGNHGLGDGSGGGRAEAPGQLARPGGTKTDDGAPASQGGGSGAAPGRLKAPGTSATGGRDTATPDSSDTARTNGGGQAGAYGPLKTQATTPPVASATPEVPALPAPAADAPGVANRGGADTG